VDAFKTFSSPRSSRRRVQEHLQLLTALAQVCGQLCNYTQLGARIGLDDKTVTRYITLLEQLFLVQRVPAWSANALARVVKTPKLQFLDSGLFSALLGLRLAGLVTNRTAFGPALECYVYAELLRLASWSEDSYALFMYRDKELQQRSTGGGCRDRQSPWPACWRGR
jgi:predicted AAA+ superfamily ATPase